MRSGGYGAFDRAPRADRLSPLYRLRSGQQLLAGVLPVSLFASGHTFFVSRMAHLMHETPYMVHTTFQCVCRACVPTEHACVGWRHAVQCITVTWPITVAWPITVTWHATLDRLVSPLLRMQVRRRPGQAPPAARGDDVGG